MAFTDVLESVYGACTDVGRWRASLSLVSEHCGARSALLMVREKASGRLDFCVDHGLSERYRSPFLRRYRNSDLRLEDLLSHPVGCVRTDTMLSDYGAYVRSPAYRHLYCKLGTEHALGGFVHQDATRSFAVRVFRSKGDGAFCERDVLRFQQLAPHLGRAVSITQTALHAQCMDRLLARTMERPSPPACILALDGSVVSAGHRGERLLESHGQRLIDVLRRSTVCEREKNEDDGSGERTIRVPLPGGAIASLVLTRVGAHSRLGGEDFTVALVFYRAERLRRPSAQLLSTVWRLTPAETRLVCALSDGVTLADAATLFGVSRETVKSQLRHVFRKVNVHRQADLVRRVLEMGSTGAP